MASVVLGVGAAALGNSLGWSAAGAALAAGIASAVGGYIDSQHIYPSLFGDEGSKESRYGAITVQTADEGAPIYAAYGKNVRVPGLVLFASEFREVPQTQRAGKRRVQAPSTYYTDVAIGFAKSYPETVGKLNDIRVLFADSVPIVDRRDDISLSTTFRKSASGETGLVPLLHRNVQWRAAPLGGFAIDRFAGDFQTAPELGDEITVSRTGQQRGSTNPAFPNVIRDLEYEMTFSEAHGVAPGSGFLALFTSYAFYKWVWMRADMTRGNVAWMPVIPELGYGSDGIDANTGLEASRPTIVDEPIRVSVGSPDGELLFNLEDFDPGENLSVSFAGVQYPLRDPTISAISGARQGLQEIAVADGFQNPPFLNLSDGDAIELTQARVPFDLDVLEEGADDVELRYEANGVELQTPSDRLASWNLGNITPGFRDMMYATLRNVNLSSYGSRLPNFEAIVSSDSTTLADVITDICTHHGLTSSDIDVSALPSVDVEGYRYSGIVEGVQALQPIVIAYDLLTQYRGGKLHFLPRSSAEVVTVDEAEWIPSTGGDRLQLRRIEQQRPARSVTVSFFDSRNNLEPGAWTERLSSDVDGEDRTINTNLVMTEERAESLAKRILRDSTYQVWRVEGSLPWTRSEIIENDIIQTTIDGRLYRFRVLAVEIGQAFELVLSGITEPIVPEEPELAAAEVDSDGNDRIRGRDAVTAHVWRGIDWETGAYNESGFFVAAASTYPGGDFQGAGVYVSADGRTTWRLATTVRAASAIGKVALPIASLGTSTAGAWEPTRSMVVDFANGELESIEEREARGGGQNLLLVGDEVVSFKDATELEQNDYMLTGFLRGVGGTAPGNHTPREIVVSLGEGIERFDLKESERNRPLAVRVVPFGASIDEGREFVFEGLQIPQPPVPTGTVPPLGARNVLGFQATDAGDGVLLSWLPTDGAELYEIRTGTAWLGARVVGRTSSTTYSWMAPRVGTINFQIRARFPGGLWSPSVATTSISFAGADATAVDTETAPLPGTVGGSGVDATETSGLVTIDSDAYEGTWTQSQIDAGSVALRYWTIDWEGYATDSRTVDELPDIIPATYEGQKWTGEGRFGDEDAPGVGDWTTPADYPLAVENYPNLRGYGVAGTPGDPTQVVIEARFDDTGAGSWTSWKPFEPQWRSSQKMQARMKLRRVGDHMQQTISRFRIQARS